MNSIDIHGIALNKYAKFKIIITKGIDIKNS